MKQKLEGHNNEDKWYGFLTMYKWGYIILINNDMATKNGQYSLGSN